MKMADSVYEKYGLNDAVPRHVAVIMDGNGRWAKKRGMNRSMGHRAGMERIRGLITLSDRLKIEVLTLYAFSTENWKRTAAEVGLLFDLIVEYFIREIDELCENNVRIRVLGDIAPLPQKSRDALNAAIERTKANTGLILNLAINYGARAELTRAVNALLSENVQSAEFDDIASRLYTGGLPEVDLLIRTGGEKRLSNFLLLQAAYAELLFTDDLFPDFDEDRYAFCIKEFQRRNRRYGGV